MPDNHNQNGRFEPIHEAHAIEQVFFVLQFASSLDDDGFSEACNAAEKFRLELPGCAEIQGLALTLGTPRPVVLSPASLAPVVGKTFRRIGPDGVIESELRVERAAVTFRTTQYTRWDAVWERAKKYFGAIVPIYSSHARISGIGLTYVDKFVWAGAATGECHPSLLLRPRSRYLCPYVYEAKDLWHNHTGAFLRIDEWTKRLMNINVDHLEEHRSDEPRRAVAITTVLTDLWNQPGYTSLEEPLNNIDEFIGTRMKQLHDFDKVLLGDIINDEMSKRIALID